MRAQIAVVVVAALPLAGCAKKQETSTEQERSRTLAPQSPAGWRVRVDRAGASADGVKFTNMAPGWHITTGPAAILYNPQNTAAGEYRLESEIFLFPGEHLEGYGVIFGGQNLDTANQTYTYLLLRKDGKFLVKIREGNATRTVMPWTEHSAIAKQSGEENAKNVIAVVAGKENVTFYVNGQQIGEFPRAGLPADGVVGLRINHRLNVHVTTLAVTSSGGTREFAPKSS